MLLFDGHVSHVNGEFLTAYRVLSVCLPPHTTHFSQPLDVSVFSPLKKAYSEVLHQRTQAGEQGVWKRNSYKLFLKAKKVHLLQKTSVVDSGGPALSPWI